MPLFDGVGILPAVLREGDAPVKAGETPALCSALSRYCASLSRSEEER